MDAPITPLHEPAEARQCAALMCGSEPWITLGRSFDQSLRIIQDPDREVFIARHDGRLAGFLILCLTGAFVGYVQTVCVDPELRGRGIGTELLRFAEDRIFLRFPNVFMCVSSFNHGARRLYARPRVRGRRGAAGLSRGGAGGDPPPENARPAADDGRLTPPAPVSHPIVWPSLPSWPPPFARC